MINIKNLWRQRVIDSGLQIRLSNGVVVQIRVTLRSGPPYIKAFYVGDATEKAQCSASSDGGFGGIRDALKALDAELIANT